MQQRQILVADTDGSLADAFRSCLERLGFDVRTAQSGVECLNRLREMSPDILLLERELLWGGGDGVAAVLRETVPRCRSSVVLMNGSGTPEECQSLIMPPVVACLQKPFSLHRLLELPVFAQNLVPGGMRSLLTGGGSKDFGHARHRNRV